LVTDNTPRPSSILYYARAAFVVIWATAIVILVGTYMLFPEHFGPERIAAHLREYEAAALCLYLALSMFRGLTLLPSTPLILAGTLLFPHQPWLVLAISLFGVVVSSGMIYWLSDAIGIAAYFERRKAHHISKIRSRLEHPTGLLFVGLWAFFPLVPTDVVCYVAGSIRMNFPKFIAAIFVGELILCSIYIFGGSGLVGLIG
jgi:uncharacterized membrane protein YdjX (TVP38/TMEM64 family)